MKKANWNQLIESHATEFDSHDSIDRELGHDIVANDLMSIVRPGNKVLDFGCGAGRFTKSLEKYSCNFQLFGYDPATNGIEFAKKRTHPLPTTFETKLVNRQYDVVISNFVLCCMPNFEQTIHQIYRVLKKGGHLLCCEPHPDAGGFVFDSYHPQKPKSYTDGAPYLAHLFGMTPFTDYWHSKSAYRNVLNSAGFYAIKFSDHLATTPSKEWKDEKIQSPYLHIRAIKI